MIEIWKDIPGYEELYAVSNYARVKSYQRSRVWRNGVMRVYPERILIPALKKGYPFVDLYKDGKCKQFTIHRLVAQVFIPNPDNLPQVCHKDDNPLNNRVDNLFWGTQKDNHDDCHIKGRAYKPKRPVTNGIQIFESSSEASRQMGVNRANITQCCRGNKKNTHAGGYKWSYAD